MSMSETTNSQLKALADKIDEVCTEAAATGARVISEDVARTCSGDTTAPIEDCIIAAAACELARLHLADVRDSLREAVSLAEQRE